MQWRRVVNDGIIVKVMEVVGVEGSRVLFERFRPPHHTGLKRYSVAVAPGRNHERSTRAALAGGWAATEAC